MRRLTIPHARRGFTLIELMVGMIIATMILGAAAGIFVTTLNGWEKGGRNARLLQAARATSDLLERHLRSALPPTSDGAIFFEGEDLSDSEIHGHKLTFYSAAGGRVPGQGAPSDQREVEFIFDPAEEDGLTLLVTDSQSGDGEEEMLDELELDEKRVQLSPLVTSFEVLYFDGTEWISDWNDTRLPQAVEFHLALTDRGDGARDEEKSGSGDGTGSERDKRNEYVLTVKRMVSLPQATEDMGEASQ